MMIDDLYVLYKTYLFLSSAVTNVMMLHMLLTRINQKHLLNGNVYTKIGTYFATGQMHVKFGIMVDIFFS